MGFPILHPRPVRQGLQCDVGGASKCQLWCHDVGESGQRRTKQKKVPQCGNEALRHATMGVMAQDMQIFYNDNHHEDDWHNEHAGDDECPAEDDDGDKDPERLPDAPGA